MVSPPFTIFHPISGQEPLLRLLTCELRFFDGQLYLDRCGTVLRRIAETSPEWIVATSATVQEASAYHISHGLKLSFGMSAVALTLDKGNTDEVINVEEATTFISELEAMFSVVINELEVTQFARLGFREAYHFSFDSKEDSENWLTHLGLVTVQNGIYEVFGGKHEALAAVIAIEGDECRYTIRLNSVERSAQFPMSGGETLNVRASASHKDQQHVVRKAEKTRRQRQLNSAYASVLDIDAYLLEPDEPEVKTFVEERHRTNLELFARAISKLSRKDG